MSLSITGLFREIIMELARSSSLLLRVKERLLCEGESRCSTPKFMGTRGLGAMFQGNRLSECNVNNKILITDNNFLYKSFLPLNYRYGYDLIKASKEIDQTFCI